MPELSPTTMGIIGTAGRRDDRPRLNRESYVKMMAVAERVAIAHGATRLVSGGAAWADHVAVGLTLWDVVARDALTLHLPAALEADGRFAAASNDGRMANHYHGIFAAQAGIDPFGELAAVRASGATITTSNGFFARNAKVAAGLDVLLAFTFGDDRATAWEPIAFGADVGAAEAGLKDGGTAHTWSACRAPTKIHVRLA